MSNYPNMSYCMCHNTFLAMEQVMGAMIEYGPKNFFNSLSRDEKGFFQELMAISEDFCELAEEVESLDEKTK